MARRDRNIEARYTFSELMDMLRGTSVGTPRKRQELRDITKDVNVPEILPSDSTSLLTSEPKELANRLMDIKPSSDIVTGKTDDMKTLMKPLISEPKQKTNLLTKKEEKQILENPVALQNYTKAGNFFARVGGFKQATPEQLSQATPEELNIYNTQRLAARNKGIGEMLLMLSDALGGRDVAMRAIERQKARQPKEEQLTAAQKNLRAYQEIEKTGTPEEIQIARAALIGIRQGKSKEQLRNEVVANLIKQVNPLTGEPYSKEDIEQQIKILDSFYGKTEEIEVEVDKPITFEIPGYTITEG
jgi:hypothetical protein